MNQIGVPEGAGRRTELTIKRRISPSYAVLPDLSRATLGTRLRYLRKRLGVTLDEFSQMTRLGHNTVAKIERDETKEIQPRTMSRILPFFVDRFREAFPNADADPYDFLIPPITLGAWIRNQRFRRGMPQKKLAAALGVVAYSVIRYESNLTRPDSSVQGRLRALFGNGFHRLLVEKVSARKLAGFGRADN